VLALVVGGTIGAVIFHSSGRATPTRPPSGHRSNSVPPSTTIQTPAALSIVSVSPASGSRAVLPTTAISVTFSSPISTHSPPPTLSPQPAGSWATQGRTMVFTPSAPFSPLTDVTLTIPGGGNGVIGSHSEQLAQTALEQFRIANGSVLRLQELLSLLDYSPLAWSPSATPVEPTDAAAQLTAIFDPPAGSFAWRNRGWPARLRPLWHPGEYNLFTRGLVMSFQADHGLAPNGHLGAGLWAALVQAVAGNTVNTGGYNYALANKAPPERLTIYHDGRVVLRSSANTGIASSPTPDGTFAVNTRLRRQVMRGTNPDGQHYADLVQYIAYFHGNDAVHYMDRADYGIPQSLGCIELPLADASKAWPYLAYGTMVTVIN
jgi:lipoprotein-anchoring transpeptidase ErfK/SrfK